MVLQGEFGSFPSRDPLLLRSSRGTGGDVLGALGSRRHGSDTGSTEEVRRSSGAASVNGGEELGQWQRQMIRAAERGEKMRSRVNFYNLEDEVVEPFDIRAMILALQVAAW